MLSFLKCWYASAFFFCFVSSCCGLHLGAIRFSKQSIHNQILKKAQSTLFVDITHRSTPFNFCFNKQQQTKGCFCKWLSSSTTSSVWVMLTCVAAFSVNICLHIWLKLLAIIIKPAYENFQNDFQFFSLRLLWF